MGDWDRDLVFTEAPSCCSSTAVGEWDLDSVILDQLLVKPRRNKNSGERWAVEHSSGDPFSSHLPTGHIGYGAGLRFDLRIGFRPGERPGLQWSPRIARAVAHWLLTVTRSGMAPGRPVQAHLPRFKTTLPRRPTNQNVGLFEVGIIPRRGQITLCPPTNGSIGKDNMGHSVHGANNRNGRIE